MKNQSESEYELIIETGRTELHYWKDLWLYRELFFFLSWRDILVRYKQTTLGIAWSVLRPLLTMIVFTIIFGKFARLPSEGIPYPIFVYAAMLPWQFFSNSLMESSNSLISNSHIITKVYFPRIIIPASTVIVSLIDFLISSFILCLIMVWYEYMPDWRILVLPGFLFLSSVASFGIGLWLSSLNVKYRDFRHIVPFLVQFGLYISPVGFSSSIVPERWRLFYSINPMVGVIDGFRWALFRGDVKIYLPGLLFSIVLAMLIFASGVWYFRKTERTFADNI